jgi:hypothetical protein
MRGFRIGVSQSYPRREAAQLSAERNPEGEKGHPMNKKKLLSIATASLFTVGIAAAQTSNTNSDSNPQNSPSSTQSQGTQSQGSSGSYGQSDSMGNSSSPTSDQSGTTDQTTQRKNKKKKNKGQQPTQSDQSGSMNENPSAGTGADTNGSPANTTNPATPDSTHPSW